MRKFPGLRVRQRCLLSTGTHVACLHFSETPAGNSLFEGNHKVTHVHTRYLGFYESSPTMMCDVFFVFKSPNLVLFGSNTE